MEEEIEDLVRRHDQFQFEVKLGYDLLEGTPRDVYKVETYFFLPHNLDINESTYTKNQFYRDLLLYLRFKAPSFTLGGLADPRNERSPLQKIRAKLDDFLRSAPQRVAPGLEYEIKLLGCVLKSSLRDHVRLVKKRIQLIGADQDTQVQAACLPLLEQYLSESRRVASAYRALRDRLRAPSVPPSLESTYTHTDEYISLLIEGNTHQFVRFLYTLPPYPFLKNPMRDLTGLIEEEVSYRRAAGYPSLVEERRDNELFLYRYSVLKKFVSSILHIPVRTTEEGKGLEHFALAIGAGMAMGIATAIAFYYQKIFGTLSLSFFLVLVISYMFKDRIKAVIQARLQKALSKNLFDHSTAMYDPFNGEKIGVCREVMTFTAEGDIDPEVVRLRNREHITDIENDWRSEHVIRYVKEVVLFPRNISQGQPRITTVNDISRLNVRSFLLKMDEPNTDIFILQDGRSDVIKGTRVYHVNMVIKFVSEAQIRYDRIRLVLTRQGIKRIEPVTSLERFSGF
ncbi:MAG: hypothetical protein HY548_00635 [Elusimicrobia bacterium]|nr:hypothetical protein [Elusimicrobiota bacterium]